MILSKATDGCKTVVLFNRKVGIVEVLKYILNINIQVPLTLYIIYT